MKSILKFLICDTTDIRRYSAGLVFIDLSAVQKQKIMKYGL